MNDLIMQAVLDALLLIRRLVMAGEDRAKAEEALMQHAEQTKARLDELKFGGGP